MASGQSHSQTNEKGRSREHSLHTSLDLNNTQFCNFCNFCNAPLTGTQDHTTAYSLTLFSKGCLYIL